MTLDVRHADTDLSVCILTHHQPELLPRCVEAAYAEIERAGIKGEVIIIDNASSDGSPRRVAARFPATRIIRNEENMGFGAANNEAIRISRGQYVLVLNDDALLQEGSLGLLVRKLESGSNIGAVGPKVLNFDGSLQTSCMNKRYPHLRGVAVELLLLDGLLRKNELTRQMLTLWDSQSKRAEPDQLVGACVLARREALDAVGLFDEGFYYVLEDADLCYRLKKGGWRVLCAEEAQVIHYGAASMKEEWTESYALAVYLRSLAYFFKKHSSPAKYFLVRMTLGLVLLLRMFLATLRRIVRGSTYAEVSGRTRAYLRLVRSVVWEWR